MPTPGKKDGKNRDMVKKISGHNSSSGDAGERKQLQAKRLKLKKLHNHVVTDRAALDGLPPDQLPPASVSNAARQARSRRNITFPVDWQKLHLKDSGDNSEDNVNEQTTEPKD